jgi:predicted nucleotidyltransferase
MILLIAAGSLLLSRRGRMQSLIDSSFDILWFYGNCTLMKHLDENILHIMTDRLVAEFDPDQIILFGSHAWGTPTENSDVDFYVIVPENNERPLRQAQRAIACLGGMKIPKDVLVRTWAEAEKYRHVYASLESQIFEKGRVLYVRS